MTKEETERQGSRRHEEVIPIKEMMKSNAVLRFKDSH